jgi:hypothetical protein
MKHRNFFYKKNDDKQRNEVFDWGICIEILLCLAVQWFRWETNIDIVQAEIHEMEADFQNLQTNATGVIIHKRQEMI